MSRRIISLYFNAAGECVNERGETTASVVEPVFHPDEIVVVNCQFFQNTGEDEPAVPEALAIDSLLRVALVAYEESTGSRLFQAAQSDDPAANRVNRAGDWGNGGTADRAAGQLSFRVATADATLNSMLPLERSWQFKLRILADSGEDFITTVLGAVSFQVAGRPTSEAISRTELEGLLQAPEEYQFRLDENSGWHTEQTLNDRHYRSRRGGGEWGQPVQLPQGSGIRIDQAGLLSARPTGSGFSSTLNYYATDTGLVYFYRNKTWSEGVSLRGPAGAAAPREIPGFEFLSPVYDPDWGCVGVLDAQRDCLSFRYRAASATKLVLGVVSASPEVSGNVLLVAAVDGKTGPLTVVPVTAAEQSVTVPLVLLGNTSGRLQLYRRFADYRDTLRDGVPVSMLITHATLVLA